jgi:tRNA(Phe) wybutosine-synthesizing methylase Tyw3
VAEAQPAEDLPYLNTTDLTFSKCNSRVTVVEADDKKNSRGYVFLIYSDHGDRQSKAVVEAQDEEGWFTWFKLRHNSETGRPY